MPYNNAKSIATILGYYEDAVKTLDSDGLIGNFKRGHTGSYGNGWQFSHENNDKAVRDLISYSHKKRLQYPDLYRMALDLLTIQLMSAEYEMLFSLQGRWLSRNRVLFIQQ